MKEYFVKYIPGSGKYIYLKSDESVHHSGMNEFQIAVMRWTDTLNSETEKRVEEDARRIVGSLNYCIGMSIEEIEK